MVAAFDARGMKTYNFKVVTEPDEDFDGNPVGVHTVPHSNV
jgi:hypothetical protein